MGDEQVGTEQRQPPASAAPGLDLDLLRRYRRIVTGYREQRLTVVVRDQEGKPIDGAHVEAYVLPIEEGGDPVEMETTVNGRAELVLGKAFGEGGLLDDERKAREQVVGDALATAGTDKWSGDGYTLSLSPKRFAEFPQGREAAVHALRQTDWQRIREIVETVFDHAGGPDGERAEREGFEQVCRALAGPEMVGLLEFNFNLNTLHALVREKIATAENEAKVRKELPPDPKDCLPKAWEGVIDVGEKWTISVTKAK